MNFEYVCILLVPLERVDSARHAWVERVLNVVVHSKIRLYQVAKVFNDFILVLV